MTTDVEQVCDRMIFGTDRECGGQPTCPHGPGCCFGPEPNGDHQHTIHGSSGTYSLCCRDGEVLWDTTPWQLRA